MELTVKQVRAHRLAAHHLVKKLPPAGLLQAAGACGLQNSPPGAWETALFHRVEGCTLQGLHTALYQEKSLLQAWSYRGAPIIFPTEESGVFLSPLQAKAGEEPWVYTRGLSAALDLLGLSFGELLPLVKEAAKYLDGHVVKSKEALDAILAAAVEKALPEEKRGLWRSPSMYDQTGRQTVGAAVVSFLLRPCSFSSLVVFGEREGASPTFTSFQNWVGHAPLQVPEAEKKLARKFLHCHGPTTKSAFAAWLGASPKQAGRLWGCIAEELEPVQIKGRTYHMLSADVKALPETGQEKGRYLLLGPHDPYLDTREKALLLADTALQRAVWKTVANPGAVVYEGRIIGTWKGKTGRAGLEMALTLWDRAAEKQEAILKGLAEAYAAFRELPLSKIEMDGLY